MVHLCLARTQRSYKQYILFIIINYKSHYITTVPRCAISNGTAVILSAIFIHNNFWFISTYLFYQCSQRAIMWGFVTRGGRWSNETADWKDGGSKGRSSCPPPSDPTLPKTHQGHPSSVTFRVLAKLGHTVFQVSSALQDFKQGIGQGIEERPRSSKVQPSTTQVF
jgi:hypothetical protein